MGIIAEALDRLGRAPAATTRSDRRPDIGDDDPVPSAPVKAGSGPGLFDLTRPLAIAEALALCDAPDNQLKGHELWCRCPFREDQRVGSFSINLQSGTWFDFATNERGDAFALLSRCEGVQPVDVARRLAGETTPTQRQTGRRRKPRTTAAPSPEPEPPPRVIPDEDLPRIKRDLAKMQPGELTGTWAYRDAHGQTLFLVSRWDKPDGKTIRPVHVAAGGKLKLGQPIDAGRPLYRLPEILAKPAAAVLIVEGERCVEVAQAYLDEAHLDMVATTWSGGSAAWSRTDWAPLQGRNVTLWPDADEPGREAVDDIATVLRNVASEVRIVRPPADVPAGWDIADANRDEWSAAAVVELLNAATTVKLEIESRRKFTSDRLGTIQPKQPDYLVDQRIERDTLCCFFGDWGSGKTFVGVALAVSASTGRPFFGHKAKHPGPVLYVAGEARLGLRLRFRAYEIRHQVDLSAAPIYVSRGATELVTTGAVAEVIEEMRRIEALEGSPVALVIIDTLSRSFGAGSENDSADMALAVAATDRLRDSCGCTVSLIHHTGHANKSRSRGSSVLNAALDREYQITMVDSVIRFECTKVRDAEPPPPLAFELRQVELDMLDDEGRSATSCVLEQIEYCAAAEKKAKPATGKNQRAALRILHQLITENEERLAAADLDTGSVRVKREDWRVACAEAGLDRRRFEEVEGGLLRRNLIAVGGGIVTPVDEESPE